MAASYSLKTKIIRLIASLVIVTTIAILISIGFATDRHANTQLSRELDVGESVFLDFLRNRESMLISAATVLTEDFGFKEAIATNDSATIVSVLNNQSERISADIMAVFTLTGETISQSSGLSFDDGITDMGTAINKIIADGGLSTIQELNGKLYQTLFLTVDAPQPIAITMIGFEINQPLVERVSHLTRLDITIAFNDDMVKNVTSQSAALKNNTPLYLTTLKYENLVTLLGNSELDSSDKADNKNTYNERENFATKRLYLTDYPEFSGYILLTHDTDILFKEFDALLDEVIVISIVAVLLTLLMGTIFSRNLTQPLEKLSIVAKKIAGGDYLTRISLDDGSFEIRNLSSVFTHMQHDISEREEKIKYSALHDQLTGLYNRNKILSVLEETLTEAKESQLLAIQINNFREVNETFGFQVGDNCILQLAKYIEEKGGYAARFSGGEVIWLPPEPLDEQALSKLQSDFEKRVLCSQLKIRIKLVIGCVNNPQTLEKEAEDILRSLSIAVSHARLSSNFIQAYHQEQETVYLQRLEILHALLNVLEDKNNQELAMFYQPKLLLKTNKVEKMEALIRWNSPKLGFISPELFIPIAERAGIIKELSHWVIHRVISDLASWQRNDVQVAINLSAQDIMSEEIFDVILSNLELYGLSPYHLSFEITESDIMDDPEKAIIQLNKFREYGFILSIDDFGTGHSSLTYIKDFPVAELKIDKSFILKLDENLDDQIIVKSIISLAQSFNLYVIAEGVENESTLNMLNEMNCQYIQGYFISRPMPSQDVNTWLTTFHQENVIHNA
ncbi:EAL domain-containing protein [Pseudocolwellia sp. HL-MZ7]|uniref:putative bifunctional diguanylate cyclase/phosphodiesterase n=1 Tax=Pseudocolwellia sp. HL-MZ7 TaxID=3400627 RepID=UPI003CF2A254